MIEAEGLFDEAAFALEVEGGTFELDAKGIPQFGLVAEEVEKVNPDLVARDADGNVYTVRYEAVNAMLLNEFLKEHANVESLKATVAELKSAVATQQASNAHQQEQFDAASLQQAKAIETLTAQVKEQTAQIHAQYLHGQEAAVSADLEEFLGSQRFCEQTDDDKTLVLAVRGRT